MESIGEIVYKEVNDNKDRAIKIADNYYFNQYKTIERINLYINNRYLDRDNDAIFWNLCNPRITHFAKNIDLDTKDLQPYGEGETSFVQVFVLKQKFYKWLEENKFAVGLNDMSEGVATYGSAVFKLVKNSLKEVKLTNIFFDPLSESIRDTAVVEMHYMSPLKLKEKKADWIDGAVDKVLEEEPEEDPTKPQQQEVYEIWERWGGVEIDDKLVYMHYIGYAEGDKEVILFEEKSSEDKMPYYDFHIGKYRGRWLRVGLVERLFDLQERVNQLVNQNVAASEIASLLLLRTQSGEQLGNVLNQVENGQIIQSDDLQQIGITNRGLNDFITELREIEGKADALCLTPQIIQGESSPSGTPFRSVAVISNAAKSSFRYIRERIGETLGYILKEKIFPGIIKEWNAGGIVEIADSENDVKFFDEEARKKMKWETFTKNLLDGKAMSQLDIDALDVEFDRSQVKRQRKVKYPKNYFNFDYKIKTNITGESVDKQQQNDAYFNALQMVQANPAIVNNPLFKQYVENNGINWWKLNPEQIQEMKQGAISNTPIGGKEDKLLAEADSTN
jgi:hypothetical protein